MQKLKLQQKDKNKKCPSQPTSANKNFVILTEMREFCSRASKRVKEATDTAASASEFRKKKNITNFFPLPMKSIPLSQ